jgi:hypothetical protein
MASPVITVPQIDLQEEHDDQDDQDGRQDDREQQVVDGLPDVDRIVRGDGVGQPGREVPGQDFHALAGGIGHGHRVRLGKLDHAKADRELAVEPRDLAVVLDPVHGLADIPDAHGRIALERDDQVVQRLGLAELPCVLTRNSRWRLSTRPEGMSTLFSPIVRTTSCTLTWCAASRSGSRTRRTA